MFKAFRRACRHSLVPALVGAAALAMFAGSAGQPMAAFGAPAPRRPVVASSPPAGPGLVAAPRKPGHRGSVAVVATTPVTPAQNVQVTATTAGSATLTWGAANFGGDTNQTYTVLVTGTASSACTNISALTCRVTGTAKAQVSLVVRAIGDGGNYLDAAPVTTTLLPPPDAVATPTATASGNDQAAVTWTAPTSWHLSTNKTYSLLVDGAVYSNCAGITALTCTFSGSDGPHAVKVRTIGDPGLSADSAPVTVTLVNAPGKPTGIHLTTSDAGTGTIAWTPPLNWHNSTNRTYTVRVDGDAVPNCTTITGTTCSFSADDFTVSVVVTAIGDVPTLTTDSDPVTLTLLPPPDAPTGLRQSAWGVGQVTVQWNAVNFNGSGTNQYSVTAGGSPVPGCANLPSTTLTCVVSGTPDSTTPVIVTAIGDVGLSTDSAPRTVELPALPDAPTNVHATAWSATQTRVSWTAPSSWHHNTDNTSYAVSVTGAIGATACVSTTNTYCDIVGGADNAASVTVSAIGDAPALKTDATAGVDLPGVPDVPTNLHATATGSGTATIAWTEPNWRHNSAHQTFVVTVSGSTVLCADPSVASCDITGTGTVPVTVQAVGDDAGTLSSAASAPVDFALIAAPTGAVDTVTVTPTAGDSHLTVEWPTLTSSAPPADWQGGAVNEYKVVITAPNGATVDPGTCAPSVADTDPAPTVSCSFSTDTDGHYSVRVIAVNEAGTSIDHTDGAADLVLHPPAAGVADLAATSVPASGHVAVSWDQLTGSVWNGATTRTYVVTIDSPTNAMITNTTCSAAVADSSVPACAFDTDTAGLYTIHVHPNSEAGLGTVDTTTTLTVALTAPSAAVTSLTATHQGSGVIHVAWTGIADAAWAGSVHHYDVHVDVPMSTSPSITLDSCAPLATSDATSAASCEFTTDTPGAYTVTVTPVNEVGASTVTAPTATAHVTLNMPSTAVSSLQVANTPGNPAVTVTWAQLADSYWQSAADRNYTVTITSKPDGATIDANSDTCTTVADSSTPSCTFDAPLAGDYQVRVVPTSEAGDGPQALASGHVTLAAPNGTIGPVTVSTSPGDSLVDLNWPQLAADGWSSGQPVSRHYTVVIPAGLGATGSTCGSVPDSSTPACHFSTTVPGSFTVTVKAVNEAGTASTGTGGTGNIAFAPTVGVAGLAAAQGGTGSKTVRATWTTLGGSDWNGGTTKKYHVAVTPPGGVTLANDNCQGADIADSANPGCTFDAPVGGNYTVTVLPVNEAGLSTAPASPGVTSHVVLVPTATVSNLHVVTTPGSPDVTVVWNRAATADWNGGVTTHNYVATVTKPSGAVLTNDDCDGIVAESAHPTCGFTADTSGTYTVTVAPANEAGPSLATSTATATLSLNPPSATVTGLAVTTAPGSGLVQLGWTGIAAPAWQGATHHYVVTVTDSPGGASLTDNTCPALVTSDATSATGCSFTTAVAGDYTVTVAAANEAGTGAASTPQTGHVTLAAPTGPVGHLVVSAPAGNPTVGVTWDQLAAGAWQSSVTKDYTVVVTKPNGADLTANTCTTVTDSAHPGCSFTTDTAGAYRVSVAPHNEAGTGTADQKPATVVLTVPTGPVGTITVDNTPSSGLVTLSWPQLGDAGFNYGATRGYAVTITGGLTLSANNCGSVLDSATPQCSFTATTPGAFTATVRAVNELGTAANGTDGSGNISFHPTAAVVNLTATALAGSTTAQVHWDQLATPNWLGGTNRRYAVSVSVPNGSSLTADSCDGSVPDGPNPGCSFTGSVAGQYTVHVTPVTEAGSGAIQDLPVTLSFGAPGPATAVSGVAGTNAVDVSWTGPDGSHQGSGLTSYAVTATATDYPTGSCPGTVTTSPCSITGLAAGVAYTVHVIAIGPGGNSVDAAGAATVTPIGAPAAPTAVPNTAVVVGNTTTSAGAGITITGSGFAPNSTVVLAFYTVPVPITTVTASPTGTISVTVNVPSGAASGSHTLLATGVDANGAVRYLADAVTVATTPPVNNPPVNNPPVNNPPTTTAPTGTVGSLSARPTSGTARSVLVSWAAGTVVWGTGSTRSYAVTVDGPHDANVTGTCTASVAGTGTSCTFSTDTDGSYRVSVTARTEAGSSAGAAATSVTVTGLSVPAAPATVAGKGTANAITVSWTAAATPGGAVTGYLVTASASGYPSRTCATTVTRSPCTISGLSGGVGYRVQVVSVGRGGNSPARTAPAAVVPTGSLLAPTALPAGSVSAGSRTAPAGARVSISGLGFKAKVAVQLRLYPSGRPMGSGRATASGGFSATVTIPKGTAGGTYSLLAFGLNPGNRARFVREGVVVPGTKSTAVPNAGHLQYSAGTISAGSAGSAGSGGSGGTKATTTRATTTKSTATGVMAVTGPAGGPVILAGFTFIIAGLAVTVSARRRARR